MCVCVCVCVCVGGWVGRWVCVGGWARARVCMCVRVGVWVCGCVGFLTSFFNKFLTITQQKSKEIQTHIHFMSFLFGEHDIQTGDRYYVDSNQ